MDWKTFLSFGQTKSAVFTPTPFASEESEIVKRPCKAAKEKWSRKSFRSTSNTLQLARFPWNITRHHLRPRLFSLCRLRSNLKFYFSRGNFMTTYLWWWWCWSILLIYIFVQLSIVICSLVITLFIFFWTCSSSSCCSVKAHGIRTHNKLIRQSEIFQWSSPLDDRHRLISARVGQFSKCFFFIYFQFLLSARCRARNFLHWRIAILVSLFWHLRQNVTLSVPLFFCHDELCRKIFTELLFSRCRR